MRLGQTQVPEPEPDKILCRMIELGPRLNVFPSASRRRSSTVNRSELKANPYMGPAALFVVKDTVTPPFRMAILCITAPSPTQTKPALRLPSVEHRMLNPFRSTTTLIAVIRSAIWFKFGTRLPDSL